MKHEIKITAKEKAKELVDRFNEHIEFDTNFKDETNKAKKRALIDINNTIEALWNVGHSSCNDEIEYHREVKQEIEKL
tara:strand:- start:77 stop:310 length:234 start_codon:yes stop_codon:yes gene_type:complete